MKNNPIMQGLYAILEDEVIFEIELDNGEKAYMSADETNYGNDKRHVVVVDPLKFLALWRNDPYGHQSNISMQSPDLWVKDRKFQKSEFIFDLNNPVPLADVVCYQSDENLPYTSFTDGITRTIWLFSKGAKYFPVECGTRDEAERMAKYAGSDHRFYSIEQLLGLSLSI